MTAKKFKFPNMIKTLVFILCLFVGFTSKGQNKSFLDVPYIEVNGVGDTLVTPNEIVISILLSEADVKNRISLEEQERKMVSGLKSMGIRTEKQLTTNDIQSSFRFYVLKQKDILKSKEYKLTVGDAVTATRVFMKLEELGIANANVESVSHTDKDKLKNSCRSKAMRNAHEKANSLTKPVGANVGAPLHIMDYSNDSDGDVRTMVKIRGAVMADAVQESLPQIDFEKIKISVAVNVKFQIKP
jgi:uncharacterized protein